MAPLYPALSRLFFGKVLEESASHFSNFKSAHEGRSILIVGGGRGQLLSSFKDSDHITYIEKSEAMCDYARKVKTAAEVKFVNADYFNYSHDQLYDLIVFPFFLDQFNSTEIEIALNIARKNLKDEGYIVVSDFDLNEKNKPSIFHKLLVWLMILFFRLTTGLKISKLEPIKNLLERADLECESESIWMNGLVFASLWTRASH